MHQERIGNSVIKQNAEVTSLKIIIKKCGRAKNLLILNKCCEEVNVINQKELTDFNNKVSKLTIY
jgi:hypothetical protein